MGQGEEQCFIQTSLSTLRCSQDKTVNKKGKDLVELMENEGFFILNGRTGSDFVGNFTFLNNRGKSVIDLIWANNEALHLIEDMYITDNIHLSDHMICNLIMDNPNLIQETTTKVETKQKRKIYKWEEDKINLYQQELEIYLSNEVNINEEIDSNILYLKIISAIDNVSEKIGISKTRRSANFNLPRTINKTWYTEECHKLKKITRKMFKNCKKHNFCPNHINEYLQAKKEYKKAIQRSKNDQRQKIKSNLETTQDQKKFWKTVKLINPRINHKNPITVLEWETYFKNWFGTIALDNTNFYDVRHPYLDQNIGFDELNTALRKLKFNKSPGADGILNEQIANLTPNWKRLLHKLLHLFFDNENIPPFLSKTRICLLHKKGDKNKPENYRNIALVNNITKLLTYIVTNRLQIWAESFDILPEAQSGFRRKRSCIDNLFVINSIVQSQLLIRKEGVYGIFIDFQKAFDSVNHSTLWRKIYETGVSGKITRLLKNIYQQATMEVLVNNNVSRTINITKGVLQGECASPLLFALYIADLETHMRSKGLEGFAINSKVDILSLQYADDIVIFANSPVDVKRKLHVLEEYCTPLELKINAKKTKILHFHNGRPARKPFRYYCQGEEIHHTSKYTYLGVSFTSSGQFGDNAKQCRSKTNSTTGVIKNMLIKAKITNWNTKSKLYETVVLPALLYASEIWAVNETEAIEKTQSNFFKHIMNWQKTTPNYIIRRETQKAKIEIIVLKRILKWWYRILIMPETRYVKMCYNKLLSLSNNDQFSDAKQQKYNWAANIKFILRKVDYTWVWDSQNLIIIRSNIDNIVEAYTKLLYHEDTRRIGNSTYSTNYKDYLDVDSTFYLNANVDFRIIRLISQLRTASTKYFKLHHDGICHTFDSEQICTICNTFEQDDLRHFFIGCPFYRPLRDEHIAEFLTVLNQPYHINILSQLNSIHKLYKIYNFVSSALKLRSFALSI